MTASRRCSMLPLNEPWFASCNITTRCNSITRSNMTRVGMKRKPVQASKEGRKTRSQATQRPQPQGSSASTRGAPSNSRAAGKAARGAAGATMKGGSTRRTRAAGTRDEERRLEVDQALQGVVHGTMTKGKGKQDQVSWQAQTRGGERLLHIKNAASDRPRDWLRQTGLSAL